MTRVVRSSGGTERLTAALKAMQGVTGQVGWFESSKYPNGVSVAYIASIQEFGYPPKNITPRMGWRAMIPTKQASWAQFAAHGAKMVLEGTGTVKGMFELVGARAAADLFRQIASVTEPRLAIPTLEARARRRGLEFWTELSATGQKPLNDTGEMIATLSYTVNYGASRLSLTSPYAK